MDSFRSGLQSLLASLGTGIEQSSKIEPVSPASGKDSNGLEAEMAEGASFTGLSSNAGETEPLKAGTHHGGLLKATGSFGNGAGGLVNTFTGQIASGSARQALATAEDTATSGSQRSPGPTQSAGTGKVAKPSESDTVDRPQRSIPAQTETSGSAAILQTLSTIQPLPPQVELAAKTTPQPEPAKAGDSQSQRSGTGALPFSKRDQLVGDRTARVPDARESASSMQATTVESGGILEPDSLQVEPVNRDYTPGATGGKSVPGGEMQVAQGATETPVQKETARGSEAKGPLPIQGGADGAGLSPLANSAAGLHGSVPDFVSPVAAKCNSSAGEKTSAAASAHGTHPSGAVAANQHSSSIPQMQPAGQIQESSTPGLTRDLSGLRGTAGATGTGAGDTNAAALGPASHDAFSTIDSEPASRASTWIHAGTNRAEAGYQDPALGWVSIRADVGGGGIHASVVPASMDAAQTLGGHLAGLSAHLAEQHVPVETLTLSAPESRGVTAGMDQNLNQNMHQGAGQETETNRHPGSGSEARTFTADSTAEVHSSARELGGTLPASMMAGAHISVMA